MTTDDDIDPGTWQLSGPGGPVESDPPPYLYTPPMPRERPIFEPSPPSTPALSVPIHAGSIYDIGPWVTCDSEEAAVGWDDRLWTLPWK